MRLVYDQLGPVYGYDTYHDYVRVYIPTTSKYLWGDGFDTGVPLCGAYLGIAQGTMYIPEMNFFALPGYSSQERRHLR